MKTIVLLMTFSKTAYFIG